MNPKYNFLPPSTPPPPVPPEPSVPLACECGLTFTKFNVIICENGYEIVRTKDEATCEMNVYCVVLAVTSRDVDRLIKGWATKHSVLVNEEGAWVLNAYPTGSHEGRA